MLNPLYAKVGEDQFDGMGGREVPIHVDRPLFVPEKGEKVPARVFLALHVHGDLFEKLYNMLGPDFREHGGITGPPEIMAIQDLLALGMLYWIGHMSSANRVYSKLNRKGNYCTG